MILYQDTNSMVKRYVKDEKGIEETRQAVEEADIVATSLLAYAEARAAFAAANRSGRFAEKDEYPLLLEDFEADWDHYAKVNASPELVRSAGGLAEKHALRGYDAVQLASALVLRERVPDAIRFATWDRDLARAAAAEGFELAHDMS